MTLYNPPPMTLIHKQSGYRKRITADTFYLEYDETKFDKEETAYNQKFF